jgi:hypothetical protein
MPQFVAVTTGLYVSLVYELYILLLSWYHLTSGALIVVITIAWRHRGPRGLWKGTLHLLHSLHDGR